MPSSAIFIRLDTTKPSTDYAEKILCICGWLCCLCGLCPFLANDGPSSSRPESLAILGREEEAKDHVPEVIWIGVQRVEPVLESDRVRVAPQIPKVLHRYERPVEELICHYLALDDVPQHLTA